MPTVVNPQGETVETTTPSIENVTETETTPEGFVEIDDGEDMQMENETAAANTTANVVQPSNVTETSDDFVETSGNVTETSEDVEETTELVRETTESEITDTPAVEIIVTTSSPPENETVTLVPLPEREKVNPVIASHKGETTLSA